MARFPFDIRTAVVQEETTPWTLSEASRESLLDRLSPWIDGNGVDRIEVENGFSHQVTVTLLPYRSEADFSAHEACVCYEDRGAWDCEDPHRLLELHDECPVAHIRLGESVTIEVARLLFEQVKRSEGKSFVTVTEIARHDTDGYWVHITYLRGFGTHHVILDLSRLPGAHARTDGATDARSEGNGGI